MLDNLLSHISARNLWVIVALIINRKGRINIIPKIIEKMRSNNPNKTVTVLCKMTSHVQYAPGELSAVSVPFACPCISACESVRGAQIAFLLVCLGMLYDCAGGVS